MPKKEFNSSVLPSLKSTLIGTIIDPISYNLYSVDSELMIRIWCLTSGKCQRSYYIETREDQIAEANGQDMKARCNEKSNLPKAVLAKSDANQKYVVIAYEGG